MRKIIAFLLSVLLLIMSFSNVFAKNKLDETDLKPVTRDVGGIIIGVDPRIELLSAIQVLSDYGETYPGVLTRGDFEYINQIKQYFKPYTSHAAVKLFTEMYESGFSYDAPPSAMLYYSQSTDLKQIVPLTDYLLGRAGGQEKIDEFINALRQFAEDTNFKKFYNSHIEFYNQMIDLNIQPIKGEDYINQIENYYGVKNNSYNIILSPVTHPGGYGPSVENEYGNNIYSILGPTSFDKDMPLWGNKESYDYIVWHEFSHSFVNPITAKNIDEVNKYENLYTPISKRMRAIAYSDWETSVNEHLLRAVTSLREYENKGEEAYKKAINNEKSEGFAYVEELSKKMLEYEENKDKYKNFEEFYPQIIELFKDLSLKNLDDEFYQIEFSGSISSVTNSGKENIIIMPTNERDLKSQEAIQKNCYEIAELLKERTGINTDVISDKEAISTNLEDKNIIVYGTVEGNLFLKKYYENLPFAIYDDRIEIGNTYSGNNLKLISSYTNPHNKKFGMVIYTAQKAEDIPNINKVFHGPTSYVVVKNNDVIASGDYIKQNGQWILE